MKKQPAAPTPTPTPTPEPAPAPEPTPPTGGEPTPPPGGETPAPTPTPAPDNGAAATPTPAPAGNTDEELAKMAAEAEKAAENGEGTVGSEVIEVTGSLVDRKTLDTPAPVSVIDREILKATGLTNVGSIMQSLPAASNGVTVAFNNGGDGSTRVNLRGLGTARTLVLLNGRRMVPSGLGADSSVDLNVIPLAMVERVEVLKDGASAIYGSDAIGGVVNVITRNDFRGTETSLYTGGTSHGDGNVYDASFVTGSGNDKGNVVFSAGYSQQDPVMAGDRDFSRYPFAFNFTKAKYGRISGNGSTATPNGLLDWDDGVDPAIAGTGNAAWANLANLCPSGICTNDGIGTPYRDFNLGGNSTDIDPATGKPKGDRYNYQPQNYLTIPLRRYNVFAEGNYKLSDHVNAMFEGLYVNRKSDQLLAPEPLFFGDTAPVIDRNSVYNPFDRDIYDYRRRFVEANDRTFSQNVDVFRLVAGLNGSIPEDAPAFKNWKWELSYNYGHTQATNVNGGSLIKSHLAAAVGPSYIDGSGVARCGTATNPGPADCVPINILGPAGSVTGDALAYLQYTGVAVGYNDQKTMLAQAHGQLAKTPWDGDIALAVGADYRKEAGGYQPDPLTVKGDVTGNAQLPTGGKYDVAEAFAELSIVPVTNRKAAKYVELDGAFRAYDYSTFGSGATWKGSALYKIPQGVSVRGTYSTAFRSPSIAELYSGQSDSFPMMGDPCDTSNGPLPATVAAECAKEGVPANYINGATQQRSRVGGNPNLQPEKATVFTVGGVIEPTAVKGLALTVDYYNVKITNAISVLGETVITNQCYSDPLHEHCDLVHRNPITHKIDYISNLNTNVGGNDASGIDYGIAYDHDFGKPGRFRFSWEGTYLLTLDEITATKKIFGIGVYDLGANPRYKNTFAVVWGKGHLGAGANVRAISGYKECGNPPNVTNDCSRQDQMTDNGTYYYGRRGVDNNVTGDIYVNYSLKDALGTTTIAVGINNVADTPPPFVYQGFYANSDASTYDFMGRFMYARLSQSF